MKLTTAFCIMASCAAFAATEDTIKTNFPASPGGRLVVDVSFGSIDVATNGVGDEIAVDVWRKVTRKKKADETKFLADHPIEFLRGGGVTCDLPVTVQGKIEHGHLKGPVNGGGQAVVLRSSGGGIYVKKL